MKKVNFLLLAITTLSIAFAGCSKDDEDNTAMGKNPDTAEKVSIDRFSSAAGALMVRDASNGLPAANEPINFDVAPFITKGYSPTGAVTEYYNFDIKPDVPAPIYVLFKEGKSTPVEGQLNIIDVLPGEIGYNDFWLVNKVTVPSDYVANEVTSFSEIQNKGYAIETTTMIVNCPVVPDGSTASKKFGGGSQTLVRGWYKGKVCVYFTFDEANLTAVSGKVPTSPIYVTFNINPDQPNGGPGSGFRTEMGTDQTHNVLATSPTSNGYSPLWSVNPYDNADFNNVSDLTSAQSSNILATGVALVNCPTVR